MRGLSHHDLLDCITLYLGSESVGYGVPVVGLASKPRANEDGVVPQSLRSSDDNWVAGSAPLPGQPQCWCWCGPASSTGHSSSHYEAPTHQAPMNDRQAQDGRQLCVCVGGGGQVC